MILYIYQPPPPPPPPHFQNDDAVPGLSRLGFSMLIAGCFYYFLLIQPLLLAFDFLNRFLNIFRAIIKSELHFLDVSCIHYNNSF